jgi:hypothetical protein
VGPLVKDNVRPANLQVDIVLTSTELLPGKGLLRSHGTAVPSALHKLLCLQGKRASASCPYLIQSIQPCGGITRVHWQENEGTKQRKGRTIQLVEKIPEAFLAPAKPEQIQNFQDSGHGRCK